MFRTKVLLILALLTGALPLWFTPTYAWHPHQEEDSRYVNRVLEYGVTGVPFEWFNPETRQVHRVTPQRPETQYDGSRIRSLEVLNHEGRYEQTVFLRNRQGEWHRAIPRNY